MSWRKPTSPGAIIGPAAAIDVSNRNGANKERIRVVVVLVMPGLVERGTAVEELEARLKALEAKGSE